MAGDIHTHSKDADDELVSAIFEVTRARTLLLGVTEALPQPMQIYAADIEQLLDRAVARLRWVHVTSSPPSGDGLPPSGR